MNITVLLDTAAYGLIGIILMMVAYKAFDLVTPYKLNEELIEGNPAVGALIGGLFIAIGIIVMSVLR